VRQIVFSKDGGMLLTGSTDRNVQVWDIDSALDSSERRSLANFARALSPMQLQESGRLAPQLIASANSLQTLAKNAPGKKISAFFNWFFADPATRSLSPNLRTTVPKYVDARIEEGTPSALEEAALLAAGDPEISKKIAVKERAAP
jgi:hypothetical protein